MYVDLKRVLECEDTNNFAAQPRGVDLPSQASRGPVTGPQHPTKIVRNLISPLPLFTLTLDTSRSFSTTLRCVVKAAVISSAMSTKPQER